MKPFNRILIATDGSRNAKAAVVQGLALAKFLDAEVAAMSVMDVGPVFVNRGLTGLTRATVYDYLEEVEAAVEEVSYEGRKIGVRVKKIVMKGNPANKIIEMSKDYDLIVIGALGRTGLSRLFIGSVAEKVVRFASCPVLVVRTHASDEGREDRSGQSSIVHITKSEP
jgi:nucleotide-binding universal stress UspA family protein